MAVAFHSLCPPILNKHLNVLSHAVRSKYPFTLLTSLSKHDPPHSARSCVIAALKCPWTRVAVDREDATGFTPYLGLRNYKGSNVTRLAHHVYNTTWQALLFEKSGWNVSRCLPGYRCLCTVCRPPYGMAWCGVVWHKTFLNHDEQFLLAWWT